MPKSSDYYNPYSAETPVTPQPEADIEPQAQPQAQAPRRQRAQQRPRAAKPRREPGAIVRFFTDRRLSLFLGVICLLIAAFALVSAVSWFISGEADQSRVLYNDAGQIVKSGGVDNVAGPAGAILGNFLLTESLGLGSLVLIFYVGAIGLRLIGRWHFKFWAMTFKCLLLSVAISIVIGLITFNSSGFIMWGGHHGYYVNRWLIDYSSAFGAICVSIALVSLIAIIYLAELTRLYLAYRRKVNAIRERRAAEQARRAAEQARVEAEMTASAAAVAGDDEDSGQEAPATQIQPIEEIDIPDEDDEPQLTYQFEQPEPEPADADEADHDEEVADTPAPEPENFEVTTHEIEEAQVINTNTFDPTAELSRFHFPSIDLLYDRSGNKVTIDTEEQEENKERIIKALEQFNIKISSIKATVGPTITLFEVVPAEGQRIAAIKRVEEDLALALKAQGIRIIAPIPGKGTIGIEVPNNDPQVVSMRSIIASRKFQECRYELPMALGATISNEVFMADLTKMPHLLVAGATGMGKSVGLNAIIASLLYKKHPAELKFVLVDPKMVEFSLYSQARAPLSGQAPRRGGRHHHRSLQGCGHPQLALRRDGQPLQSAQRGWMSRRQGV